MSDVSRFALTIIAVFGTVWIIKSSWQGSLKWVSQQSVDLDMSNGWQQIWRGLVRVLGPIGAALFYLFNPNLDTKHAKYTPSRNYDLPTDGFEDKTQGAENTQPPEIELCLMVTENRSSKGPKIGQRYNLMDGAHTIGREPTPEPRVRSIAIKEDPAISKNHIYLDIQNDGSCSVIDRKSAYGTRINGQKLIAGNAFPFNLGDVLKLGNTTLQLQRKDEKSIPSGKKVIKKAYRLRVVRGNDKGKRLNITEKRLTIGRSKESDFRLSDNKVSRLHAEIHQEGEQIVITDLGSTHGMFVNDLSIASRSLVPDDNIKLGDTLFVFEMV